MKWLLVAVFALNLSCHSAGANGPYARFVRVEHLAPGGRAPVTSGLTLSTRTVVVDQAAFESLWRQAFSGSASTAPMPSVDFTQKKVVFVALGERSSSGHEIRVKGARRIADELVIEVEIVRPGDCPAAAVMTQPMDVVAIPRTEPHVIVRFIETTRVGECP